MKGALIALALAAAPALAGDSNFNLAWASASTTAVPDFQFTLAWAAAKPCHCGNCGLDGPPAKGSYEEAHAKAVKEKKAIAVWLDHTCVACEAGTAKECVHYHAKAGEFAAFGRPAVLVSYYADGKLWWRQTPLQVQPSSEQMKLAIKAAAAGEAPPNPPVTYLPQTRAFCPTCR